MSLIVYIALSSKSVGKCKRGTGPFKLEVLGPGIKRFKSFGLIKGCLLKW